MDDNRLERFVYTYLAVLVAMMWLMWMVRTTMRQEIARAPRRMLVVYAQKEGPGSRDPGPTLDAEKVAD